MKSNTNHLLRVVSFVLLAALLAGCGRYMKFIAPQIEPPTDLIPSYVPEGFELVSGFQLTTGKVPLSAILGVTEVGLIESLGRKLISFDLKSPDGNDIQGVYYQSKDQILLISKSYFPEASLDLWRAAFEASQTKPCDCDCAILRLDAVPLPSRLHEIWDERTINSTSVIVLKGPLGWTTVFVRGDYLLAVESGISLDENLKVVSSLLGS